MAQYYRHLFADFELTKNNQTITFGLYKDNALITGSERTYGALSNTKTICQLMIVTSVSGTDNIKVKVNTSNSNTDGIVYDRNIILLPLN